MTAHLVSYEGTLAFLGILKHEVCVRSEHIYVPMYM